MPQVFLIKQGQKKDPNRTRNVFKLKGRNSSPWVVDITVNKKRIRRFFEKKKDATDFFDNWKLARKLEISFFALLSGEQRKDIKDAIAALPEGKTLAESVKRAWSFYSKTTVEDAKKSFISTKENLRLDDDYIKHVRTHLDKFNGAFKSFDEITSEKLIEFLKARGTPKTISHYKASISEFFKYCVQKEHIQLNPFDRIAAGELPTATKEGKIEFLTVEKAREFMEYLEANCPKYCRFYALALFAGVRIDECERFEDRFIDYDRKEIIFPKEMVKGGKKSWIVSDFEPNLWAWLEEYKDQPFKRPNNVTRTKWGKILQLPKNFARHTFSTYHFSLYRNAERTKNITRHNTIRMLEDTYIGALVRPEEAKAFFEIMPNTNAINLSRPKTPDISKKNPQ